MSKVYFTDLHATPEVSLLTKLRRLVIKAGLTGIDMKDKFAAIKIHFGEYGNLAYLRPNYAKVIADIVKENGGKPFLTDCNTLYPGGRKNALDHIDTAYLNGFSPFSTGCHVIIGDGIRGEDDVEVPVEGGEYVRFAKIGRAIMDADVFISMNHFKGHDFAGFGGALKNIGMGCGSAAGKADMHSNGLPIFSKERCAGCGICVRNCGSDAVSIIDRKAVVDESKCRGCARCIGVCPRGAVRGKEDNDGALLNRRIAEYAKAVLQNRPHFHISFVVDVSPSCDCLPSNDMAIVPDVGIFASFDPVALDVACADAVNAQSPQKSSAAEGSRPGGDHFGHMHPDSNWRVATAHAEKLGIGEQKYELIKV
ncbi:MAG: DUF362 domain-containing protein [Oscillospiraceae bacterium]|jgi:uncharacterized Fe-S center protein